MESLAFLVAVIVLVTVLLGPISIMLSRLEPMSARIVGYISGVGGVLAGLRLATVVDSPGARIIGGIATGLGGYGLWLNWRRANAK